MPSKSKSIWLNDSERTLLLEALDLLEADWIKTGHPEAEALARLEFKFGRMPAGYCAGSDGKLIRMREDDSV